IGVVGDLYQGSVRTGDRARFRRDGTLEVLTPLPTALDTAETVAERGALEELNAGDWSQLLGLEHVGLRQSFFTLGGHSMLATRMVLRLRDLLKLDLPFRMLFEHPTVAGLAQAIRGQRRAADLPLEPGDRGEHPPLSFAQQRLWFIERLDPGTAVLNIPSLYSLRGPLQMGALKEALFGILRRHETLRTTISVLDEQPFQAVHPPSMSDLPVVDLTALPAERRESEADRAATLEASRPFDLDREALVRFLLLHSGADDHCLLATFHHLVADGGSMPLFERELAALYAGRPSSLADLPVQYADYAAWQRRALTGEYLARQMSFWRERLATPLPVLRLPTDRPRPEVPSSRGTETKTLLPPELTAALRELSRREGSTLYITLLAAYLALLHRATGQRDLTLGVPVSLRDRAQVENLIGLFVNTLVIRAEVVPTATFREHLAHVRERALEAFAHWDVPFERLVEELQPERGPHDTPFFQLMFAFQSLPETTHRAADLELRPLDLTTGTSQFELTLYLLDTGKDLTALAEYRTELYDAATIEKMLGAFRSLLEAAVANPEIAVADLPLQGWPTAVVLPAPAASQPSRPSAEETDAAREARLTEARSQLSSEQRDLLRQRLQRRKG
ncbi:MAG TPA: condensation domain-containing protein, partial [Thermoanaerobaculia bacterium]|nr:condensation domain-containing protein [Thermoanaerobaculia bacterium]